MSEFDPLTILEGHYSLVIKSTDGQIAIHYRKSQDYTETGLGMPLSDFADALADALGREYEDHALEETTYLEQFCRDGGVMEDLDVVSGYVVYPEE